MILAGDETVVIHRQQAGAVDSYGNPTFTTNQTEVANCLVVLGSTSEPIDPTRSPVDSALTIYCPHGTVIDDGDEFEVRGDIWHKDGDVIALATVGSFEVGVIVHVRRRRG